MKPISWAKKNPIFTTIGTLIISLPALWAIYIAGKKFKVELDGYIKKVIIEHLGATPDRLEAKFAIGLNIPSEDVAPYLLTIIQKYENKKQVGLYIEKNEEGDVIWYRHTDGKRYRPQYYEQKKRLWFRFDNGDWKYCD